MVLNFHSLLIELWPPFRLLSGKWRRNGWNFKRYHLISMCILVIVSDTLWHPFPKKNPFLSLLPPRGFCSSYSPRLICIFFCSPSLPPPRQRRFILVYPTSYPALPDYHKYPHFPIVSSLWYRPEIPLRLRGDCFVHPSAMIVLIWWIGLVWLRVESFASIMCRII